MRAFGYLRVSTEEQAISEAGLIAQRTKIIEEIDRRGWELGGIFEDAGWSAKDLRRPEIQKVLACLKAGDVLVVAKLDRLSRSILDFVGLMERARKEEWGLVMLDVQVDTTTPAGKLMAGMMALFAEFERELIGQRTREGLAVKKSQGVVLGRPERIGSDVRARIVAERGKGMSLAAIARGLNEEKVPTVQGGICWWPSTVSAASQAHG